MCNAPRYVLFVHTCDFLADYGFASIDNAGFSDKMGRRRTCCSLTCVLFDAFTLLSRVRA